MLSISRPAFTLAHSMNESANPFLDRSFEVPWHLLTPDKAVGGIEAALAEAQKRIDAIAAQTAEEATFESAFLALEAATEPLSRAWGYFNTLDSVANSPALREANTVLLPKVSNFYSGIPLNEKLWASLKSAAEKPETVALSGYKARFRDETLADFRESGADLPPDKKSRLAAIEEALATKTQKYSENCLDSLNAYELVIDDESRLAGLPPLAKEAARQSALKKGHGTAEAPKWRFTLHAPSYIPVMEFLEDDSIRKELYEAYYRIGAHTPHDNTALVKEILELRAEKASLLGKQAFADVVTERRMAGSGKNALTFVENLRERVFAAFEKELAELERFKAERTGEPVGPLEPWQFAFWSEKLRRSRYDFDTEMLRPFFAIDSVINGLFRLCERLFGIAIAERTGDARPPVWHDSVKFYDVRSDSGAHLGSFYADWHPRESKRSGAWMCPLITGEAGPDGKLSPHLGLICGNLTAPLDGKPALLTHDEVTTIFHEFGHLLHHLFGSVPIRTLNGTNVAWDFVELPSQILENWCWERESLDFFARHFETGETIPDTLFQKMVAARTYAAARIMMRQLMFGKMDLEMHLRPSFFLSHPMDEALRELLNGYRARTKTEAPFNHLNFGHLFSSSTGYAAGYYSYKWAEVLEADAYSRFKKEGILNPVTGKEFREKVLAKGNAEPPQKLFRDFMGRDPNPDALLIRSGLLPA